jgi:2,2-dialkylglycine decarboxylase (pyruvate)
MNHLDPSVDREIWTRARRHLLNYGGAFVPEGTEGSFLDDASGRRVLDFASGQMSAILGHCHPEIVATVREWVARLDHLFSSMISAPVVNLAHDLAELVPDLPKVMFLSTGTKRRPASAARVRCSRSSATASCPTS